MTKQTNLRNRCASAPAFLTAVHKNIPKPDCRTDALGVVIGL